MYSVYILHSPCFDKYYVGQTPDLQTRLLFHNQLSDKSYTSKYRPWELKRSIPVSTRSAAMLMEAFIKGRKSKKYLIRLIQDDQLCQELAARFDNMPTDRSVG